mmetsp:Transcript_22443/g.29494  ORF Transcript_22443/g.29494 Transcript_22443/m.29494 type:complete len:366 (+) Transcript_22443:11-1108(+)|eukprot:CAMPEP_0195291990 /NCGR_PEP_ID=MMETSP0707-20130614/8550_1 /TAXON_ID=33640 /ORGANISM="Asterionellopsis glacialis, Strain CCMP134" /LENGTH=365 /DNA_ID=CAMNT_0040352361 /DNA_START=24 /DNA_END=1121 /DNA_ORIENTATION=+
MATDPQGATGGGGSWLPKWLFERPTFTFLSLQEELNALPEEERIRVQQDKIGEEDETYDETPEFVNFKIKALAEVIEAIDEKEAYETALFINPQYVESDELRLSFLRADRFDEVQAAKRMVRYWERKVDLFGTESAFKPSVSIMSLKEKDYAAVAKGGLGVLPLVDAGGRGMFYSRLSEWEPNMDTMHRLFWYTAHVILFDSEIGETTQRRGIIMVGGSGNPDFDRIHPFHSLMEFQQFARLQCHDFINALPVRCITPHIFSPNAFTLSMIEHTLYHMGSKFRKAMSVYDVTQAPSNMAALGSYGIPPNSIPTDVGGTLDYNYHQWLYDQIFDEFDELGYDFEDDSWRMEYPHLQKLADYLEEFL